MGPRLGIDVAAPATHAWDELVDLASWPHWGPTVRGARLDDGSARLHAEATGAVQTPVGLWIPFRVEAWAEDLSASSTWSWRVSGVPATTHTVRALGPERCRVEMGVPWWAPAYLGVVAIAVRRIKQRAEQAAVRGPAAP